MQAALSERIRSKLGSFTNFPMSMKTKLMDQHGLHFVGGVCALPTFENGLEGLAGESTICASLTGCQPSCVLVC